MISTRERRTEQAFFRGGLLTLADEHYLRAVRTFAEALLRDDVGSGDLTAKALGLAERIVRGAVISREGGVVAGLDECAFLFRGRGIEVAFEKRDGDAIAPGETLMRLEGPEISQLACERVGLNLVQRMCGIATAARCLQERVRRRGLHARVVGTRKTPWGLLDKRALHLGGAGTHRLNLSDAILIKNNHLALLAPSEAEAAPLAIERAWKCRGNAAFIEVEVRDEAAALGAAQAFRRLRRDAHDDYPCLLMLDNMTPGRIGAVAAMLERENLRDDILIEASGGISEANIEAYAESGVDAISVGTLTHSARALDICLRIS